MPNPFIVIEAIDGAGKSTQTKLLNRALKKSGYTVHAFHFPQDDKATGQLIYKKYLNSDNHANFSRREQALLYLQDFFSQLEAMQKILQQRGKHVLISDRYYTSTLAYQTMGLAKSARKRMTKFINDLATKGKPSLLTPDLVIYLDMPAQVASNNLEQSKRDYHENLTKLKAFRLSHLKTAQEEKWTTVNCVDEAGEQRPIKDIHQEIWHHVQPILKR